MDHIHIGCHGERPDDLVSNTGDGCSCNSERTGVDGFRFRHDREDDVGVARDGERAGYCVRDA